MTTVRPTIKRKNYYEKEKQKIYTIGEFYKSKIFDLIAGHREGVLPHQIRESVNIMPKPTRQTIHVHLRELLQERKIYKKIDYILQKIQILTV